MPKATNAAWPAWCAISAILPMARSPAESATIARRQSVPRSASAPPPTAEHAALVRVVAELHAGGAKSTGRLYAELFPHQEMSRDDFENLLGGMARAGIVRLDDAVFEKDGRQIPYRTARLTPAGLELDARTPVNLVMKEDEPPPVPRKRKRKVGGSEAGLSPGGRRGDPYSPPGSPPLPGLAKKATRPTRAMAGPQVEEALRAWRLVRGPSSRRACLPHFDGPRIKWAGQPSTQHHRRNAHRPRHRPSYRGEIR